ILLHNMGPGLADDILQGQAGGDEFRTAPLWGLGQRIFFLHDGRTTDLIEAIQEHKSAGNAKFGPSEANAVVNNFNGLTERKKQQRENSLRTLWRVARGPLPTGGGCPLSPGPRAMPADWARERRSATTRPHDSFDRSPIVLEASGSRDGGALDGAARRPP